MSEGALKTVVVLRSEEFDYSLPDDDSPPPDDLKSPLGRDLALFVMRAMSDHGCSPTLHDPVSGEGGWHWDIEIAHTTFALSVMWAPIGNPSADCWVIQSGLQKGLFRTLFGRATQPEELVPVCDVLHRVLDSNSAFSSVEWLTWDEFCEVY